LGIDTLRYRRIATEGALLSSLSGLRIAGNIAIVSDDAGQFNVLTHGLCWVHAEILTAVPLFSWRRPSIDFYPFSSAGLRACVWS